MLCREVFQNFDPVAVSKLNEKKIAPPGSPASTLLSEVKLRAIIENARQTCKVCAKFSLLLGCPCLEEEFVLGSTQCLALFRHKSKYLDNSTKMAVNFTKRNRRLWDHR